MKEKVEEQGSIPVNALKAIKVMMIPFKELEKGEMVEGTFEVLSFKADIEESRYSSNVDIIIWALSEDGKKFRVKTTNSKTNSDFVDQVIDMLKHENEYAGGREYYTLKHYPERGAYSINVKGKYDGWKVSRAKISFAN